MTHNTDIGDSWSAKEDYDFFIRFAAGLLQLGMNVLLYSMTH